MSARVCPTLQLEPGCCCHSAHHQPGAPQVAAVVATVDVPEVGVWHARCAEHLGWGSPAVVLPLATFQRRLQ